MSVRVERYSEKISGKHATVIFATEGDLSIEEEGLKALIENHSLEGKSTETEYVSLQKGKVIENFLFQGLGKKETLHKEGFKKALSKVMKEAKKRKLDTLILDVKEIFLVADDDTKSKIITETGILAGYRFDKYKTVDKEQEEKLLTLSLKNATEEGIKEGQILGESTLIARDLVNEPANIMTPANLSKEAEKRGKETGFEVQILKKKEIEALGMGAFLSVAEGSDNEPVLIVMRYANNPEKPEEINGIVGKGLIYDSGGLSIKPTNSMLEMKSDMSGAAAVIGAFASIAKAKLKVNAVGVIAACENMISGKSYRPGDILTTMAGKTVFVGNTDAEGRLTLVDAISYLIKKEKVSNVLDIATLTGAAVVALGDTTTAVVSNNDDFYRDIEEASKEADERIWRLPIFEDYREKIKAKEADLTNSAGNPGTITAALFIEAFVEEIPWVHLDIAGTSYTEKEYDYYSLGGTGCGVRTIYQWLKKKSS